MDRISPRDTHEIYASDEKCILYVGRRRDPSSFLASGVPLRPARAYTPSTFCVFGLKHVGYSDFVE